MGLGVGYAGYYGGAGAGMTFSRRFISLTIAKSSLAATLYAGDIR
jgi:hypothetical protein